MTCRRLSLAAFISCLSLASLFAQNNRISAQLDSRQSVVLQGHVHPQARAANDRGAVEDSFPVPGITLILKPSTAQKAALQELLAQQQDPSSPQYHKWLTPEQYAAAYSVSADDMQRISDWLTSQGFTVGHVSRGRNFITFNGTAAQARTAFRTQIHRYVVNGEQHYANASAPSIPAALSGIVSSIHGLSDFRLKPRMRLGRPELNSGGGHRLAPADIAAIYNIKPLYDAGVDGTGQSIAVIGQTQIKVSDITAFRTNMGLPAANLQQVRVPGSPNPGISSGDEPEADLDIEWSGAVAPNAKIIYVYSNDVITSAMYAIDSNLAPVMTMSYGGCEQADLFDLPSYQTMAQQANAQGMTWINASGDSGAADCEDVGSSIAQDGLAVDAPASIPEVTGLGGTTFLDQGGAYWSSSGAALSYIPETVWNDTSNGFGLASGGGGGSVFFPQPGWQTGPGVPKDGVRHVPDLSLSSSADHDPYYFYSTGSSGGVGGTSVASPVFAGIVSLLNQYLVSTGTQKQAGLGNINPALYRLAQSSTGVFHDVIAGHNRQPCVAGSPDCVNGTFGIDAGAGYDSASGLGSVDAFNLAHAWSNSPAIHSAVTLSLDQNPVFQQTPDASGNSWRFTLTLTEEAGIPTTLTAVTVDGVSYLSKFTAAVPAGGSVSANLGLRGVAVPKNVVFVVSGVDAGGATWTQQLSIPFAGPQPQLTVSGIGNAASYQQAFAPGMIMSVYGTGLGSFAQSFGTVPLPTYLAGFEASINGVPAPLYYVSPNQVNLQIPYETSPGPATLVLGNPWQNVTYKKNFTITSSAPGIFMQADGSITPFPAAARGDTITMYITGDGQVTPSLATGSAPSSNTALARLPRPRLPLTVTVGGVTATTTFFGIPPGYVGVTQVNFTIPAGAPSGVQPVVVTVGTQASAPANLRVQ
jgi:uncharacterized protein (TIGR03437 family)